MKEKEKVVEATKLSVFIQQLKIVENDYSKELGQLDARHETFNDNDRKRVEELIANLEKINTDIKLLTDKLRALKE